MEFLADENGVLSVGLYQAALGVSNDDSWAQNSSVSSPKKVSAPPLSRTSAAPPARTPDMLATSRTRNTVMGLSKIMQRKSAIQASPNFVCSPAEIAISDFQIGKTYTIELTITNVSKGFSTFRAQPVPPQIRDCFDIKYDFPSRIPAGLSWPVTVIFTPKREKDICDSLLFRAENGTFAIPLTATVPKSCITVQTKAVSFGVLSIGEAKTQSISIRNTGALGGTVALTGSFRDYLRQTQVNPITQTEQLFFKMSITEESVYVHPHSVKIIDVTFTPFEECEVDCSIIFSLKSADGGADDFLATVGLNARSTGLPVYVAEPAIDLMWCFYGETYSHPIRVVNSSSVSAQVTPRVPSGSRDVIRFEPMTMTVQPSTTYEATLYFTPNENLESDFRSLIEFHVRGQALPTSLDIRANLTTTGFRTNAGKLNFGTFFSNEEVSTDLEVTNECNLPQDVWAVNLPPNVTVHPESATLLPLETFTYSVALRGECSGPITTTVTLRGQYGAKQTVKVDGMCVQPKLALSESSIRLPSCSLDGKCSASIVLSNVSSQTREFDFSLPTDFLRVSPSTGVLKPGESLVFALILSPQFNVDARALREASSLEVLPPIKTKKISTKHSVAVEEELQKMKAAEEKAKRPDFTEWKEQTVMGRKMWSKKDTVEVVSRAGGTGGAESTESLRLAVHSVVIEPAVLLRATTQEDVNGERRNAATNGGNNSNAEHAKKAGRGKKNDVLPSTQSLIEVTDYATTVSVDFGDIGLKTTSKRVLFIHNKGSTTTDLSISPPLRPGAFFLPRPPRSTLNPHEEEGIEVRFTPVEFGSFAETMTIVTSGGTLLAHLSGRCSETDVTFHFSHASDSLSPSDGETIHNVRFPPTVISSISEITACLSNNGSTAVRTTVRLVTPDSVSTSFCSSAQPFVCHPADFDVLGKSKADTSFFFQPRVVGNYVARARIEAGSLSRWVTLSGFATAHPTYVIPPGGATAYDFSDSIRVTPMTPPCAGLSPDYPLQLRFLWGETKTFTLGSVNGGPAFDCTVGGWTESYASVGWGLSVTKLSVGAGSESSMSVSLNATDSDSRELVPCCRFTLSLRCITDTSNDRVFHVSCTGP